MEAAPAPSVVEEAPKEPETTVQLEPVTQKDEEEPMEQEESEPAIQEETLNISQVKRKLQQVKGFKSGFSTRGNLDCR